MSRVERTPGTFSQKTMQGRARQKTLVINGVRQFAEDKGEVAALIRKRAALAGNGESLTGRAAAKHVGSFNEAGADAIGNRRHVAEIRDVRVVVGEHCAREGLNLREPRGLPAERVPRNGSCFDTGADGAKSESHRRIVLAREGTAGRSLSTGG